jgi:hypothetical protein
MKAFAISLLLLLPLAIGCSKEGSGGTTYPVYQDGGATPLDRGATPQDHGSPDTGQVGPQIDTGPAPDFGPRDIPPVSADQGPPKSIDFACGRNLNTSTGTKKIGAPCTDHAECATGYCYDEWYLGWAGGFRFCTIACNGCPPGKQHACADFDEGATGGPRYKCLLLKNSCHTKNFGEFEVAGLCAPECGENMQNCDDWFGPVYSECASPPYIKTGDCGSVGVSPICFVPDQ